MWFGLLSLAHSALKSWVFSSQESLAIDLLSEGYSYCGLAQANNIVNSRGCLLDLIFVKELDCCG